MPSARHMSKSGPTVEIGGDIAIARGNARIGRFAGDSERGGGGGGEGITRPSVISLGGFSEIESSHSTGTRAKISTRVIAIVHSEYWRAPTFISTPRSPFPDLDAEAFEKEEGDQHHTDEDQHRDRRAEPQVQPVDQLVEAEDRHRFGVLRAPGHDEDRAEHA